jgi:ParB family transcriptional regulator, chromosome partitioning protein
MATNHIKDLGRSEATRRALLELPASLIVLRDIDVTKAKAYEGDDPKGTKSLIVVWKDDEGRYVARSGVRRLLHTGKDARVTAEVQRLEESGREYAEVDPTTLLIGVNVRKDPKLTKDFKDNIGDKGVIEPIVADINDDGRVVVIAGQRRTYAAVATKLERVGVIIDAVSEGDAREQRIDAIGKGWTENKHRADMEAGDSLAVIEELTLELNMSAGDIAKELTIDETIVEGAIAAVKSKKARKAAETPGLDLMGLALIAEFEGHATEQDQLLQKAKEDPRKLPHLAQQLRDRIERERVAKEAIAALKAKGVKIVPYPHSLWGKDKRRYLEQLRPTPDDKPGTKLTVEAHEQCAGHAATRSAESATIEFLCLDFAKYHAESKAPAGKSRDGGGGGKLTDQEKLERKLTSQRTPRMRSATKVRRKFIVETLLTREVSSKSMAFVLEVVANAGDEITRAMQDHHPEAVEWLKLKKDADFGKWRAIHPCAKSVSRARPETVNKRLLAIAVGAVERRIDDKSWRNPSPTMKAYIRLLEAEGYVLDAIEELMRDWKDEYHGKLHPAEKAEAAKAEALVATA